MELGAVVCTQAPKCAECPIRIHCGAYADVRQHVDGGGSMATAPPVTRFPTKVRTSVQRSPVSAVKTYGSISAVSHRPPVTRFPTKVDTAILQPCMSGLSSAAHAFAVASAARTWQQERAAAMSNMRMATSVHKTFTAFTILIDMYRKRRTRNTGRWCSLCTQHFVQQL